MALPRRRETLDANLERKRIGPLNSLSKSTAPVLLTKTSKAVEFLYLDQEAMLDAGVLDMHRAVDAVGRAQALYAAGEVRQPHKVVLRREETPESEDVHGRFNGLSASIGGLDPCMGMKWIGSYPSNRKLGMPRASALVILNDPKTGFPLAIMDGTLINAMRTGAMTALGVHFLAPRVTRKVGVIGSGVQSRTQILGLYSELPEVEEIALFGRHAASAAAVADDCRQRWGAPVRAVSTAERALTDADVALTITTAGEPVMFARLIKPGALTIQLAGHECEFAVLQQCSKIVMDDWEVVKHRGIMTPAIMYQQGLLRDDDIYANLGELILGRKPGRQSDEERIHYCHMGMGLDDVALAWSVYQTAKERGIGIRLPLWREPLWV